MLKKLSNEWKDGGEENPQRQWKTKKISEESQKEERAAKEQRWCLYVMILEYVATVKEPGPPVSWQPKSPSGSCLLSSTNALTTTFDPHS